MRWFALLLIASATGCSTQEAEPTGQPVPVTAELREFAKTRNQFAFELYHRVRHTEGNLVISPYSVNTAMAMVYAGAGGQTAEEIKNTLHFPVDRSDALRLSAELRQSVSFSISGGDPAFKETNHMWPADNFQSHAKYQSIIRELFSGGVTHLPYSTDTPKALRTINDHVSKATKGRIPNLLKPEDIPSNTRLALTNAIVFDAHWASPFAKEDTKLKPFHVSQDRTVMVHTMTSLRQDVNYYECDTFEIIDLPLRQSEFSFAVILPNSAKQVQEFEAEFSEKQLSEALSAAKPCAVELSLPKFSIAKTIALIPILKRMGITLAFTDNADFTELTGEAIRVHAAVHKADIAIDEAGARAAAATAVVFLSSRPRRVSIDRSFLIAIVHRPTQAILFLGRISDPSVGN